MAAVAEALSPWTSELGLKWPNDLVAFVDGRLRKLGGIIGETRQDKLVLGVGVNLTHRPDIPGRAIKTGSLADLYVSTFPDRITLAKDILFRWRDLGAAADPAFLWPTKGTPIRWEGGEGICQGWEPDGRLKVATKGSVMRLTAGDVSGMEEG
jgi:BirA family biotin operon repressor/biotin-[acetyl-CoA-carboxylase] ligase